MTEEKWQEIKTMVKDKFSILQETIEPLYLKTGLTDDKQKKIGDKEVLVFFGPMGKIKLEYIVKPLVLEKKEHYSRRSGTHAQTEYILSSSEFTRRLEAYKWSEGNQDWQMIDANSFS